MTQGLAHTVDGVGPPPRRPPTFAFSPTCLTSLRLKPNVVDAIHDVAAVWAEAI